MSILKILRLIVALALFIAVVVWVEHEVTWLSVWQSWKGFNIFSLFALFILTFAGYLLRAYRIYYIFAEPGHSFSDYLNIHLLHNALNNFLPMRLGEVSFPILMKRRFEISFLSSSSSLLWIRLVDLHYLISCMLLILSNEISAFFSIAFIIWFGLPAIIYKSPGQLIAMAPACVRNNWSSIACHIPQKVGQLGVVYLQTAILWGVKLIALCIVLMTFIDVSFYPALFGVITADLSSVLPVHGVAGTGTYEAALIGAMSAFINYSETLLLATVNVHIYLLISTLISIPIAFMLPARHYKAEAKISS